MLKILKPYRYLYDVAKLALQGKKIPIDEFNILGGRKSGKSVSVQVLYGYLINLPVLCGLFCIRASMDGAKEFFRDTCATLDSFGIEYKANASRLIIKGKHNTIRFIGLNSMSKATAQKAGLARVGNVRYIFKYFEERFEFTTRDYLAVQEAIRGMNPSTQMITFNVCNPWAKSSEYVSYCGSYQQWDQRLLMETGSQLGMYKEKDKETGIETTKLFHYTNWRAARDVLSVSEINQIRDTWKTNKNRALTTDYGLPGYENGSIYGDYLHNVAPALYQGEAQYYIAGMDYGWSQRANGGKTACYFGTANMENGVDILAEYVQDNTIAPKSPDRVSVEIVEFYIKAIEIYMNKTNMYAPPRVVVRVDNMNVGIISMLNNVAQRYRVNHWLHFIQCRKYPIQDRIEVTAALMGGQWLRIHPDCKNLFREFELASYEEIETQKRKKENDHSINAFEYAIEGVMYKMARNLGIQKLKGKVGMESRIW